MIPHSLPPTCTPEALAATILPGRCGLPGHVTVVGEGGCLTCDALLDAYCAEADRQRITESHPVRQRVSR